MSTQPVVDAEYLSPECATAQARPEYADRHGECRQTDVLLPHSTRILLQRQCPCPCHRVHRPRKART